MRKLLLTVMILMLSSVVYAEEFTVNKLPNGQTVVIYEMHNNPIVTIDTWIKTGSINETDANNGISHFLEHLFFKGTKKHPTGEADKILESKGAIVNAATSKDFTHYYITIPSEHFDTALEIHSDMLLNPQIPRKEMEKERKVVLEEIAKDRNTPSKKAYNNLNELMYTTHPYKRTVIGTENIVGTMRREEILEYFNKHYAPSNMITLVVGDVDTQKTLAKIHNSFNQEYKKPIKYTFKKEHPLQTQKKKIEYDDVQLGYIMIGFRGANIASNDTYALDVLSKILGGSNSSRFYRDIKEQKGLAYSISSSNASFRDDGIFYITANFIPSNKDKLEKAIFEEISRIKKYGITEEELIGAKKMITQETYYARESTSDISTELGYIMSLTGNTGLYTNYLSDINKVSTEQVQTAAQKYLGQSKSAVSIILPESMKNITEQKNTQHSAKKISENNHIAKYVIDNDSTLLISENTNNDIIAMHIIAKGGEFLEKKIGEGTLTAETILKGTKKYSSQELRQILDENGIDINVNCADDFFTIDVKTTTAQIDKTFEILDEIINNATFDEYELEKKRNEILLKIRQKRDIPMNIALEDYKTLIFGNSVYSHTGKILEKTLPSIDRNDVINYYNRITDAKNIIISVNGNINTQTAIQQFGSIFKNKNNQEVNYSGYHIEKINAPENSVKEIKDLQTAWLFMGWQTVGVQDKKDFVTLKVINTLLGSGLSSRLYRNIRESDGLAYQLGSAYSPRMLSGNFMMYIGTNPSTLNVSRTKMLNEINRLKNEFISDTELADAKARLKGGFIIAMETNSEKASNIGIFEAYGFGYDFLTNYIRMIEEVTASDIVRVANKYFNSNIIQAEVR